MSMSVWEALLAMMEAVRSGDMAKARGIGGHCAVPLSLTTAELAISGKLSAGAESTVFRGKWRGQEVAVKKLRIATSADLDRFRSELAILARLRHPTVVPLLGARALPPDYLLVLPLAAGGTLRAALYEAGWRPGWRQVLGIAHQLASGMAHVHAAGFLHRDLKPANILLLDPPAPAPASAAATQPPASVTATEVTAAAAAAAAAQTPRVQIADFGLAVRFGGEGGAEGGEGPAGGGGGGHDAASLAANGKPTGGFHKKQMVGTLEYMAPELLLRSAPASAASDVYAWAVTVNELATGTVPFSDCTKDNPEVHTVLEMGYGRLELAAAVAAEGLRPCLPRHCPPGFADLMRACWAGDPGARPGFGQVVAALEALLAEELPAWEAAKRRQPAAAADTDTEMTDPADVPAAQRSLNGHANHHNHHQGAPNQPVGAIDPFPNGGCGDKADAAAPAAPAAAARISLSADARAGGMPPNGLAASPLTGSPTAPTATAACASGPEQQPLWPFILCPPHPDELRTCGLLGQPPNSSDGNGGGTGQPGHTQPFLHSPQSTRPALQSPQSTPEEEQGCVAAWVRAGRGQRAHRTHHAQQSVVFNAGAFEAQGPRDSMEDRHLLLPDLWGRGALGGPAPALIPGPAHSDPQAPQQQPGAQALAQPDHSQQQQQQEQEQQQQEQQQQGQQQQGQQRQQQEDEEQMRKKRLDTRRAWEQQQQQQQRQQRQQQGQQGGGGRSVGAPASEAAAGPAPPPPPPLPPLDVLPPVPVAAVFDGHRGAEAAEFCRARLPGLVRTALRACGCPAAALRRAFARLEEEYHAHWRAQRAAHLQLARGPTAFPGATALVALIDPCPAAAQVAASASTSISIASTQSNTAGATGTAPAAQPTAAAAALVSQPPAAAPAATVPAAAAAAGPTLYVANAGDCRAVLVRRRAALPASRDHTGLLGDERARLAAAGVGVSWQHGGWRVGATGLQVTRCIGDFDVKPGGPAASTRLPPHGVTAVPEVTRIQLTPDDAFLILASDGLWDVMSIQEAAGLVFDTVKDPTLAAKRLACEALMRGAADNVTALVAFLTPDLASLERVYCSTEGGEAYGITGTAYGSRTRLERDRAAAATADELRDTY